MKYPDYLISSKAFPVDPENLPLIGTEFDPERKEGVHGVFEDALPDSWGRRILAQKWRLSRADQTVFNLLKLQGSSGLGAFSFWDGKTLEEMDCPASISNLSQIIEAAIDFDAGNPVDVEGLMALFTCGSAPGGARPKALVEDENKVQWLAKFPRSDDQYHVESLEAATSRLAKDLGLNIPEFQLLNVGKRKAFLIQRFDISDQGGRNHMISMQTLLNADNFYYLSYSDLFDKLNRYSCQPQKDIDALFRQMVFNMALGNTDDHLKNFCMLRTEKGLHLSPAYDLVPNINNSQEHQLSFPQGCGSRPVCRDLLSKIGGIQKVRNPEQIIDDILVSVSGWEHVFRHYEVPEQDIQRLRPGIERRLSKIRNLPDS